MVDGKGELVGVWFVVRVWEMVGICLWLEFED